MKKPLRIGIGGSAADPMHLGHRALLEALFESRRFDLIIWIPCGDRYDKVLSSTAEDRRIIINLTLTDEWVKKYAKGNAFLINFRDLGGENTPTIDWINLIKDQHPGAEVVWFTGTDSFVFQEKYEGQCQVEHVWTEGDKLLKEYPFLVVTRPGYPHPIKEADKMRLPDNHEVLDVALPQMSSSEIRKLIAEGDENFEAMMSPEAAAYIKAKKLYGWIY